MQEPGHGLAPFKDIVLRGGNGSGCCSLCTGVRCMYPVTVLSMKRMDEG